MIRYCVLLCVLFGVAQPIPAPGHGALVGYCDTSDQCDAGECCVSFIQPRKRIVLDSIDQDLAQYVKGRCQKEGTTGSDCFIGSVMPMTKGLYYDCPCASGYTCASTGMWALDKGTLGKCAQPVVRVKKTVGQECLSGADCAATECCVSHVRPLGKRAGSGSCQPMGTDGLGCLWKIGSGRPNHTVFQCPCMDGLTCHGSVFFGEMGKCGI